MVYCKGRVQSTHDLYNWGQSGNSQYLGSKWKLSSLNFSCVPSWFWPAQTIANRQQLSLSHLYHCRLNLLATCKRKSREATEKVRSAPIPISYFSLQNDEPNRVKWPKWSSARLNPAIFFPAVSSLLSLSVDLKILIVIRKSFRTLLPSHFSFFFSLFHESSEFKSSFLDCLCWTCSLPVFGGW